jgi:hypothetical protein
MSCPSGALSRVGVAAEEVRRSRVVPAGSPHWADLGSMDIFGARAVRTSPPSRLSKLAAAQRGARLRLLRIVAVDVTLPRRESHDRREQNGRRMAMAIVHFRHATTRRPKWERRGLLL